MTRNIYIRTIKQISSQEPLSDNCFLNPVFHNEPFVRCVEPDYKQFFEPNEARRLGKILKRALLISRKVLEESGVENPQAIITGTGLGCIENTEIFLNNLVRNGEYLLKPTSFMQSTHNTISSLIAIDIKSNSYNITYAHKGISYESALLDAFMQIQSGQIQTALVGAYDEMTSDYFNILKKANFFGSEGCVFAGETSVGMLLADQNTDSSLCKIEAVELSYRNFLPDLVNKLQKDGGIDAIMCSINGNAQNDAVYYRFCKDFFPQTPLLHYKHLFGESYTASAFGVYIASLCLKFQKIPSFLFVDKAIGVQKYMDSSFHKIKRILCVNLTENGNNSFILMSICGKS